MQDEHRREVGIEAQAAYLFADEPSMLAEQLLRAGSSNFGNRRHRRDGISQSIHRSAFHIGAKQQRCFDRALRVAKQGVRLGSIVNIALEKNDAAGTKRVEHDPQARRHAGTVKAHD